MESRFAWDSPASRLVLSAALDALADVGYAPLILPEIRSRAGAAGELIRAEEVEEVVATALAGVRLFPVPEPTGSLRGDLVALLRPWLAAPSRDERAVAAVLSAAEWRPCLKAAVVSAFDRPLAQVVGAVLARASGHGSVDPARVHTLNWLLRGLALDRLRAASARSPVDLEQLIDQLVCGLGPLPAAPQQAPDRRASGA